MGYRVEYNPELRKYYPRKYKNTHTKTVRFVFICAAIAASIYLLNTANVLELFLPGDRNVTATAASDMVQRVRTGESVTDAVFCFFRDVVSSGSVE